MTIKDVIAQASTIGDVIKMMADVEGVDDETIREALATKTEGQRLGERMVEMGAITTEQLARALELQGRMRTARNVEQLSDILDEVQTNERRVRAQLGALLVHRNEGATP